MSTFLLHQLLHGYRKGHQLLAGSVRLPADSADLVARLSDLSGVLPPGTPLLNYLTVYPVTGSRFFAVARTFLDEGAPRSGCVLTHTLLVPADSWRSCRNPAALAALLAPEVPDVSQSRFDLPLEVESRLLDKTPADRQLAPSGGLEFVSKYFGEGVRPIVWFDCETPEASLWAILGALWPSLRQRFAACTFCLQPRSAADGLFDLMFAPGSASPRFHGVPREGLIRSSSSGTQTGAKATEPWVGEFSKSIFGGVASPIEGQEVGVFRPTLKEEPTSVRTLFLVRELRTRLPSSPTAGVGLMDLLEAVAPGEGEAAAYKEEVLLEALDALDSAPPRDALKSLFLISERLAHPAFATSAWGAAPRVSAAVFARTPDHIREALSHPCRTLSPPPGMILPPYTEGLLRGLERQAGSAPEDLLVLREFPDTAGLAICLSPRVAIGYLRGAKGAGADALSPLVRWVGQEMTAEERENLRETLLPVVERDEEVPLAEELLRDVPAHRATWAIDVLFEATNGFRSERLREVACELLAAKHPAPMRKWGKRSPRWSNESSEVVAASFDISPDGFRECVEYDLPDGVRRSEVLAAFLDRTGPNRYPAWLRDFAQRESDFLLPLLSEGTRTPPRATRCITRMLGEAFELAIAKTPSLLPVVGNLSGVPFFADLVDQALRSAVRLFVIGDLDRGGYLPWQQTPWGQTWIGSVPASQLLQLLRAGRRDGPSQERAWDWVAQAPASLYQRNLAVLPEVLAGIIPGPLDEFTSEISESWVTILRRAKHEARPSTHLQLCADAMTYSFSHLRLPLGGLVAEAFPTIHESVSSGDEPEVGGLFRFFHWDRAKELRKSLIDSFLNSCWRPSDLAVAAGGEPLLRKLFKRIRRRWKGENYIDAMLQDLRSRTDPPAVEAREILVRIASDPDFFEPWD